MENKLETLIKKIIFKKFPSLYEVEVEDQMKDLKSFSKTSYVCRIKSYECLTEKEQMEIDSEIKFLFSMIVSDTSFRKPTINSFFDCGEGYEFRSSYGYNR